MRVELQRDIKRVYDEGMDAAQRSSVPALADLAEVLGGSATDDEPVTEVVEALLHRGIARMQKQSQAGATALFGIGEFREQKLGTRRDNAAPLLGYSSGDSLRQSQRQGRKVTDLLIADLVDQLLSLAAMHTFYRRLFYGDARLSIRTLGRGEPFLEYWSPVIDVMAANRTLTLGVDFDPVATFGTDKPDLSLITESRLRVAVPTTKGRVLRVRGFTSYGDSDLAEDSVDLIGTDAFKVEYVPGSTIVIISDKIYRTADDIVTSTGMALGSALMTGILAARGQWDTLVRVPLQLHF